mgnify:CR=1 FL=1
MNLSTDEAKVMLEALRFSTDVYEDQGKRIQDSPTEHLCYLKEKALITKLRAFIATASKPVNSTQACL